ncbi:hypothetical protein [Spirillospora albida]|uniref:hypothetical protein n=1 Tax=Spirillospora albida TaxID=58123 RepID=UPI0004C0C1E5|nr:hypothetical protein [Spirillospora albida]
MNATVHRNPEIRFQTSGKVTEDERAAAERAVRTALDGRGSATVQVTLSIAADPALPRPALAQAVADLEGRRLRAQAAAPHLEEAIDLLRTRLTHRLAS